MNDLAEMEADHIFGDSRSRSHPRRDPAAEAAIVLLRETDAGSDPEIGPWLRALIRAGRSDA